jgi:hypothetical protein
MRWNFWSGEAAPATDTAATTVYVPTLSTAAPAASASTSTSVSTSTTTSASASGEAAGPDATAGEQTAEQAALALRFSATLKDEEKYQEMQFPSYDEVPGCMRLL